MYRDKGMTRVLVPVATAVMCALLTACSKDVNGPVREGDKLFAQKDYVGALVRYQTASKRDEMNAEVRQKLARTYMALNDRTHAVREIVRAADLAPDDARVQLDAARALLANEQFEDAKGRAEKVIKRDPKNAEAQILRGNASAGLQNIDAALLDLEKARELLPNRAATLTNIAALKAARGESKEAEAAYKQAIVVAPQDSTGYLALASYYYSLGRPQESERVLLDGVKAKVPSVAIQSALAALYIRIGRSADAEAPLKVVVESSQDPQAKMSLADFYVAQKRQPEAKTILTGLAASANNDVAASATARLASIEYDSGNRAGAYQMLDKVIAGRPNDEQMHLLKSEWLLKEGKKDTALEEVRAALKIRPNSPQVQFELGRQLAGTDEASALRAYNESLRLAPGSVDAMVQIAGLNLRRGDLAGAEKAARDALNAQPVNLTARLILIRAQLAQNHVTDAEESLKPLTAAIPNSPQVAVLQASARLRLNDAVGARQAFERALKADPNAIEALDGIATLDLRENRVADARARVAQALAKKPQDSALRLLNARVLLQAKDFTAAEAALQKLVQESPNDFEAFRLLGQLYYDQKRLPEALRQYEQLAQRDSSSLASQTMVGMLYEVVGNMPAAEASYKKALALSPRAPIAANNLAFLYAQEGRNLDEALSLAQTAVAGQPENPDMNDTLGWVLYKRGMAPLAVASLRRATESDPNNAEHHYHLGLAFTKVGDNVGARRALEKAIQLKLPSEQNADASRVLASLSNN